MNDVHEIHVHVSIAATQAAGRITRSCVSDEVPCCRAAANAVLHESIFDVIGPLPINLLNRGVASLSA